MVFAEMTDMKETGIETWTVSRRPRKEAEVMRSERGKQSLGADDAQLLLAYTIAARYQRPRLRARALQKAHCGPGTGTSSPMSGSAYMARPLSSLQRSVALTSMLQMCILRRRALTCLWRLLSGFATSATPCQGSISGF